MPADWRFSSLQIENTQEMEIFKQKLNLQI